MKISKNIKALSLGVVLGTQLVGCGGGQTSGSQSASALPEIKVPAKAVAPIQKLLYASNVLTAAKEAGKTHVLTDMLLAELEQNGSNQGASRVARLMKLKPSDIQKNSKSLFAQSITTAPVKKSAGFSNSGSAQKPWDELSLMAALKQIPNDIQTDGETVALSRFESNVEDFGTQIVEGSAVLYQDATSPEFNQKLKGVIDQTVNASGNKAFYPDSPVAELAKVLPADLKVTAEIKKVLADPASIAAPGTVANAVIKRVETLTFDDLKTARNDVNNLIGAPALNSDEASLKGGLVFHKIDAGVNLAGFFMDKILGDSKAASEFTSVAKTGVAIAKIVSNFDFGKIGADVCTGNIVAGVSDLLGVFSGPSPDTLILQGIASIREDISDLRVDMDAQFGEVDHRLDVVNQNIVQELTLLNSLTKSVAEVKTSIDALSADVTGLTLFTESGFDSLIERDFTTQFNTCLGPDSLTVSHPDEVSTQKVADCLSWFNQRATDDSADDTRTGSNFPVTDLATDLGDLKKTEFEMKLGFLRNLIAYLQIPGLDATAGQNNTADWQAGTDSYLMMRLKFPNFTVGDDAGDQTLEKLDRTGKQIQSSLRAFGNPVFLTNVLNAYEAAFNQELTSAANPPLPPKADLLRMVLERAFEIAYTKERLENADLISVFDSEISSLPSSGDMLNASPGSDQSAIKNREHMAALVLRRYIAGLEIRAANVNSPTLVDATLERLELFMTLNHS